MKFQNVKVSDIIKQMKFSRSGMYETLSKDVIVTIKKRSGRPRKTSQRQNREILWAVPTQKKFVKLQGV